jgi:hypothetical protein
MDDKIDIIDVEEDTNIDILEETYNLINKRLDVIESLNKKTNDYELLKIKYKKLEDENKYLTEKKEQLIIKNDDKNKEIKELKQEIMDQKKKSLMLKALIKMMIKNYGIEEVSKATNLNLEQLKKYLQ